MPTVNICTDTPFPTYDSMVNKWPWADYNWSLYEIEVPKPLITMPDPMLPNVWNTVWSIEQAISEMIKAQSMALWKVLMDTLDEVLGILGSIPAVPGFNLSFPDLFDPAAIQAKMLSFGYDDFPWPAIPNLPVWPNSYGNSHFFKSLRQPAKEMLSGWIQASEDYMNTLVLKFLDFIGMIFAELEAIELPTPPLPVIPTVPTMAELMALLPAMPTIPSTPGPPYIPAMPDLRALIAVLPPIPGLPFTMTWPPAKGLSMTVPDIDIWTIFRSYLSQFSSAILKIIWDWIDQFASMLAPIITFVLPSSLCFPIAINLKAPGLPVVV